MVDLFLTHTENVKVQSALGDYLKDLMLSFAFGWLSVILPHTDRTPLSSTSGLQASNGEYSFENTLYSYLNEQGSRFYLFLKPRLTATVHSSLLAHQVE